MNSLQRIQVLSACLCCILLMVAAMNLASRPEEAAVATAPMPIETRVPISLSDIQGRRTGEGDLALRPGEAVRVRAIAPAACKNVAWRLRLIGEVDVDRRLRTEWGFSPFYQLIDDALDRGTTHHRSYNLLLRSGGELYPRRAYWRVFWDPATEEGRFLLKVWMKKQAVEILPGGRVGIEVAVYQKRPGRNPGDITGLPDATYFLDGGEGTQDWQERQLPVSLNRKVSCVLFTIVGEKFRGNVWFEDPQFPGPDGMNSLPPFAPSQSHAPFRNWLGENFSEKEWPKFKLTLNGKEFFLGKLYQPVYSWPAAEVDVPVDLLQPGENDLAIQLMSDYYDALAFNLRGLEWLRVPNGNLEVLACPRLVDAGKQFSALIKTRAPGFRARVSVAPSPGQQQSNITPLESELIFPNPGMHFVAFRAGSAGPGGTLVFHFAEGERQVAVERVVDRPDDGVLVGTGDSLYVPAEPESFRRFHAWYLHHSLGNSIVYRPIYRWGGSQVFDPETWREAVRFSEAAGLKYSLILDGRELPGTDGNPPDELLAGPLFRGPQMHEHDGEYDYWGVYRRWPHNELFHAVYERFPARGRAGNNGDPRMWGGHATEPVFFDPHRAQNMREAAAYFVENIRRELTMAQRHSGPSTLFKYFFQAGYKWLAAETMYGPHEIILGALRGASHANGSDQFGAHIAAQWSTTPHDDPWAFRRYFLALATPYIHGVEQIYLEDGLWHMEEGYTAHDRFSIACQGHLKVHQDFYQFTRAHSRRGRLRIPVGFLQGQYDGWDCFQRRKVWGQEDPDWDFAEPEKSWDLLKVFFPRSVLSSIYREPCPHEPAGFFSGTPFGPADIVPVEASAETLLKYPLLIFLGWNTADAQQLERLRKYVHDGGHLILALPHLSTGVERKQVPLPLATLQAQELLGLEIRGLKTSAGSYVARHPADQELADTLRGQKMQLGEVILHGAVSRVADSGGTPVVVEFKLGRGRVTFMNAAAYPADAAVEGLYQALMREAGRKTLAQERASIWVKGTDDVSFAVYDWNRMAGQPATHTVYLLNVDWWSDVPRPTEAQLLWQDVEMPLNVTRGKIHMLTASGDWGMWTQDNETDVMSLHSEARRADVKLQGQGATQLKVLYRPAAHGTSRPKLCGESSQGPLSIEALNAPGLWQTSVKLHGPEQLHFSVCP